MADKPFLTDIKTLREQARQHIEQGLSRRATGQTAPRCSGCSTRRWPQKLSAYCATNATISWRQASMRRALQASFCSTPRSRCTPIRLRSGLSSSVVSPIFLLRAC